MWSCDQSLIPLALLREHFLQLQFYKNLTWKNQYLFRGGLCSWSFGIHAGFCSYSFGIQYMKLCGSVTKTKKLKLKVKVLRTIFFFFTKLVENLQKYFGMDKLAWKPFSLYPLTTSVKGSKSLNKMSKKHDGK